MNLSRFSVIICNEVLNDFFFPDELHVFHIGKRNPPFQHWEPIYIGTHDDPLYDERLSWEGRSDKMTQVFFGFHSEKILKVQCVCM